ncbi:myb-like protein A [Vespula squamosa]|uniref:Myb-like protein A n=1 Tax=Vespula squamosa TaxID=30214 RepID=A0ABD2A925_VESSQ
MHIRVLVGSIVFTLSICCSASKAYEAEGRSWNYVPNTQYHIQTDEGPERYFRFQTLNGQFRKEKRLADGTVIGTEAWLDPLGYLRYKDYIADHQGYRILKSKMTYVGKDTPIHEALIRTKDAPAQSGVLVKTRKPPNPFRKPNRNVGGVSPLSRNDIRTGYYTPTTIRPITISPYLSQPSNDYYPNRANYVPSIVDSQNSNDYTRAESPYYRGNSVQPIQVLQPPVSSGDTSYRSSSPSRTSQSQLADDILPHNEVHTTANGFEYYLRRQYHEEEREPNGESIGSFGYIDPFGIRRVIYYKTDPQTGGFVHKKNNRYVGFAAKPYDPSPPDLSRTNRMSS